MPQLRGGGAELGEGGRVPCVLDGNVLHVVKRRRTTAVADTDQQGVSQAGIFLAYQSFALANSVILVSAAELGDVWAETGESMSAEFEIMKARPQISIRVTRDSVCAGDDIDAPHERLIKMPSFTDPEVFTSHVSSEYLPTVAGYGHIWDCLLNGDLVGSVSSQGFRAEVREIQYAEENHAHFVYHSAPY